MTSIEIPNIADRPGAEPKTYELESSKVTVASLTTLVPRLTLRTFASAESLADVSNEAWKAVYSVNEIAHHGGNHTYWQQ